MDSLAKAGSVASAGSWSHVCTSLPLLLISAVCAGPECSAYAVDVFWGSFPNPHHFSLPLPLWPWLMGAGVSI